MCQLPNNLQNDIAVPKLGQYRLGQTQAQLEGSASLQLARKQIFYALYSRHFSLLNEVIVCERSLSCYMCQSSPANAPVIFTQCVLLSYIVSSRQKGWVQGKVRSLPKESLNPVGEPRIAVGMSGFSSYKTSSSHVGKGGVKMLRKRDF